MSNRAFKHTLFGVEWNGFSIPELLNYDRKLLEATKNGDFVLSTEQSTVRRIRASVKALSAELRAKEIEATKARCIALALEAKAKAITEAETDVKDHAANFAVMAVPDAEGADDVISNQPLAKKQPVTMVSDDDGADFGMSDDDNVGVNNNSVNLVINAAVPPPPVAASSSASASASASASKAPVASVRPTIVKKQRQKTTRQQRALAKLAPHGNDDVELVSAPSLLERPSMRGKLCKVLNLPRDTKLSREQIDTAIAIIDKDHRNRNATVVEDMYYCTRC